MSAARRLLSTSGPRHAIVWLLTIGWGMLVAFAALWTSPIDQPVAGSLDRVIEAMHVRGMPSFVDYGLIEFLANIALFIPLGLLFGLVLPVRAWFVMLLCGPALSVAIELIQHVLPARDASPADVLANTVGSTIGVLIALGIRAVVGYRDRRVIARHCAQRYLIDSVP